jgi:two-component system, cell cycle response regulator
MSTKADSVTKFGLDNIQGFGGDSGSREWPSFRGTAIEIIRLAGDPDCSFQRLVDIVKRDPTLSVKVLRLANSALLSLESEVTTVSRAVNVIGVRALRNMAICFAACDAVPKTNIGDFDLAIFLEDSLRRAVAAETLSSHLGLQNSDEAFTIGLLQDYGVLALAMQNPERASEWMLARRDCAEHRREHEIGIFGQSHDEIALEVAKHSQLPASLAFVMHYHHKVESAPSNRESELIQLASWAESIADVFIVDDRQPALDLMYTRLKNECKISEEESRKLLDKIPSLVEEYAQVLGLHVPPQEGFEDLLRVTNRQLAEMNVSYQELMLELQKVVKEKQEMERELRLANARLERLAGIDPLTEIANRRHFEKYLTRQIQESQRKGSPLTVLLVDIDKFKNINDTYGHPFGDIAIRAVASSLENNLRGKDLVARVGGEEFAVILPETDHATGSVVAERLRLCVRKRELACGASPVQLSISLGGATLEKIGMSQKPKRALEWLIKTADDGLLESKKRGRNRVTWIKNSVIRMD